MAIFLAEDFATVIIIVRKEKWSWVETQEECGKRNVEMGLYL